MTAAPIRVALCGAGLIGRSHAAILAALPREEAALVAIADPSPEAAELAHALGVPHHADVEAMLDAVRPDAAIVATPNQLHGVHARACLDRGVAVLVEKPMAGDVATAEAMAAAAEAAGVPLLVGQFRRHSPVAVAARALVAAGALGRLVTVEVSSTVLKPAPYFDTAWRRAPGGGPILINLVHDIDLLRHLCGEIDTVQAMTSGAVRGLGVEDTAAVLLRFEAGALGTVILSDAAASPFCWDQTVGETPHFPRSAVDPYRLSGTEGTLEVPSLRLWRYPGARGWTERFETREHPVTPADPLERQTRHFLRVVRGEEAPLVSGADGARTVAATLAVALSAAEGGRAVRVADTMGRGAGGA